MLLTSALVALSLTVAPAPAPPAPVEHAASAPPSAAEIGVAAAGAVVGGCGSMMLAYGFVDGYARTFEIPMTPSHVPFWIAPPAMLVGLVGGSVGGGMLGYALAHAATTESVLYVPAGP